MVPLWEDSDMASPSAVGSPEWLPCEGSPRRRGVPLSEEPEAADPKAVGEGGGGLAVEPFCEGPGADNPRMVGVDSTEPVELKGAPKPVSLHSSQQEQPGARGMHCRACPSGQDVISGQGCQGHGCANRLPSRALICSAPVPPPPHHQPHPALSASEASLCWC